MVVISNPQTKCTSFLLGNENFEKMISVRKAPFSVLMVFFNRNPSETLTNLSRSTAESVLVKYSFKNVLKMALDSRY